MKLSEFKKLMEDRWPDLMLDNRRTCEDIAAVKIGASAIQWVNISGEIHKATIDLLDDYQIQAVIRKQFTEWYPNLFPFIDGDMRVMKLYVNRPGHKETVGPPKDLTKLNEEAGKAMQPGWFFCKFCRRGLPREKFCTSHFATQICTDCAPDHPNFIREAQEENYE